MREFVTAKTFPVGEDGRFQSEPAEAAYEEAAGHGLDRDATRRIIQAYQLKMDECDARYEAFKAGRQPA